MRKLAVFDMDGTLLDTLEDIADACNHALRASGLPTHPVERYRHFVGSGVHNLIKRAMAPTDDAVSTGQVEAAYRCYYEAHAQDKTKPYPGAVRALEQLRGRGVGLAILSNKGDDYVKALAQVYFPGLLDAAWGHREGVPIKPDPGQLLMILEQFGCGKEDCVYFGDSDIDMFTGKAAGVYTVGVSWGFRTKDELKNAGADVIIDECAQIPHLVVDN